MNLIKNILKSIAILFGIVILVALFGIAIMMVFNVEIFGYKYVKVDNGEQILRTDVNNANKISIQTNGVAVEIVNTTDASNIEFKFKSDMHGLFKTDSISDFDNPVSYTAGFNADNVYEIVINEPSGLYLGNACKLTMWLPITMDISDLSIKTGTDKITFSGNTTSRQLDNLSMEVSTDLKDYTISDSFTVNQNLTLKTSSGRFYVNAKVNGNVDIESNVGTFIFDKSVGSGSSSVSIKGANPSVEFGNIDDENSNVDINGDIAVECNKGGLIKVSGGVKGTVSVISSPRAELHLESTAKQVIATDGFEKMYITNLNGDATINKGDGYLYIKNCNASNLTVAGNKNDVVIENLYGNADITNNYGSIDVTYMATYKANSIFKAHTENGMINVKNVPCKVDLSSEKGNIYAEFVNIVGSNVITTNNQISVKVKDNLKYNLTAKSKSGGLNISLGSANFDNWDTAETVDGYKVLTTAVNGGSASNSLLLQTESGRIEAEILQ
ncbi:MAG: hypothetical protein ACI4TT_02800 [Christensenellales bacterium]